MKNNNLLINSIETGSIAWDIGLGPGDCVLSVNGEAFSDILEYRFLTSNELIDLEILKKDGEHIIYEIEKDEYEDLGINFKNALISEPRSCRNRCIFCFIDQLPAGLRASLYFKDDDTRLSFLTGNYVTLTNMDDRQIDKIISLRISPINISVHTTDDRLRIFMLGNKNAGGILEKIKKLTDGRISVNCQVVLVKGVNDGEHLTRTISDLAALYPFMSSLSVVPAGLTKYRDGLFNIKPFEKRDANAVIEQINAMQSRFLKLYGSRIVYPADEFYLRSDYEIPRAEAYEELLQIENGVGLLSSFIHEAYEAIDNITKYFKTAKTIVTGELAFPFIRKLAEEIMNKCEGVLITVIKGKNRLLGEEITVTGLLCGADILHALNGVDIGDALVLSQSTLRAERDLFLDGMTKEELTDIIKRPVLFVENSGSSFVNALIG